MTSIESQNKKQIQNEKFLKKVTQAYQLNVAFHKKHNIKFGFMLARMTYNPLKRKWGDPRSTRWLRPDGKYQKYNYKDFNCGPDQIDHPLISREAMDDNIRIYLDKCVTVPLNYKQSEEREMIYFISDTSNIARIDIDDPQLFMDEFPSSIMGPIETPNIQSRNGFLKLRSRMPNGITPKHYQHLYVKMKNLPNKQNIQFKRENEQIFDLLNGQAAWYNMDTKIKDHKQQIMVMDYTEVLETHPCNTGNDFNSSQASSSSSQMILTTQPAPITTITVEGDTPLRYMDFHHLEYTEQESTEIDLILNYPSSKLQSHKDWLKIAGTIKGLNLDGNNGYKLFKYISNHNEEEATVAQMYMVQAKPIGCGWLKSSALVNQCYMFNDDDESDSKPTIRPFNPSHLRKLMATSNKDSPDSFNIAVKMCVEYLSTYIFPIKGSSMIYMEEIYGESGEFIKNVEFKDKTQFIDNFEEFEIFDYRNKKPKSTPIIKLFLKYGNKRFYKDIKYLPAQTFKYDWITQNNTYNLWRGWKYVEDPDFVIDMKNIDHIYEHFKEFLCSGRQDIVDYTLSLYKLMLEGKKTSVIYVVTGDQGCGKNLQIQWIGEHIVGEKNFAYMNATRQLVGDFTGLKDNKCMVLLDELDTWNGDNDFSNMMKSLSTQYTQVSNQKFKKTKNIADWTSYFLLSNNDYPVRVEGKGDRHYYMNAMEMPHPEDTIARAAYFQDIVDQMKTDIARKTFYHLIMKQDITNFSAQRDIPITPARKRSMMRFTPPCVLTIRWLLEHLKDMKTNSFSMTALYEIHKSFCDYNKRPLQHWNVAKYSRALTLKLKWITDLKKRGASAMKIEFDLSKLEVYKRQIDAVHFYDTIGEMLTPTSIIQEYMACFEFQDDSSDELDN